MLGKNQRFGMLAVVMTFCLLHMSSCSRYAEHTPSPDTPHSPTIAGKKNTPTESHSNLPGNEFQTFQSTGEPFCFDEEGRPVILLFTHTSCSHCQWIGDLFDFLMSEYIEKDLIQAHHYDLESKDDLLTETVEDEIPRSHLDIGKQRDPEGYLPYFNFGCRYERVGNGYEKSDDLAAEAMEMTRVIEAVLRDK